MRVALLTGPRQLEVSDVPSPELRPGSVIVEIERCGIGGPDLAAWATGDSPAPAWFGHEWVGRVVQVGDGSPGRFEGERVVGAVPPPCGTCRPCVAGIGSICEVVLSMIVGTDELASPHGAFAEQIRVDSRRVHRLPEGVDIVDGALAEPAAVAAHAVRRAQPSLGDTVMIIGAGTVGLLVSELARLAGASRVVAVDVETQRIELACAMGADAAFLPGPDVAKWLRAQGHGMGADIVFDCAGGPDALAAGVDSVRPGGVVVLVGITPELALVSSKTLLEREISIKASLGYTIVDVHRSLDLMANERFTVSDLIGPTVGFDDLNSTFSRLVASRPERPKVLFSP